MAARYPSRVKIHTIGHSVEGRPLKVARVGTRLVAMIWIRKMITMEMSMMIDSVGCDDQRVGDQEQEEAAGRWPARGFH